MPNLDPSAATSRPAFPLAVIALVLSTLAPAGVSYVVYKDTTRLETKDEDLNRKVEDLDSKLKEKSGELEAIKSQLKDLAGKCAANSKPIVEVNPIRTEPVVPPPSPPPPPPLPPADNSLETRVGSLEKKHDVLAAKLKDSSGKLLPDGAIAKAVQEQGDVDSKLKDVTGKLKDVTGKPIADGEIGKAIRQVGFTKEDVATITRSLAELKPR